jgi:hypothetical protein
MVGTKHVVWFQSFLPCSPMHISRDREAGIPAPIVAQVFWQTIHFGERVT